MGALSAWGRGPPHHGPWRGLLPDGVPRAPAWWVPALQQRAACRAWEGGCAGVASLVLEGLGVTSAHGSRWWPPALTFPPSSLLLHL